MDLKGTAAGGDAEAAGLAAQQRVQQKKHGSKKGNSTNSKDHLARSNHRSIEAAPTTVACFLLSTVLR